MVVKLARQVDLLDWFEGEPNNWDARRVAKICEEADYLLLLIWVVGRNLIGDSLCPAR